MKFSVGASTLLLLSSVANSAVIPKWHSTDLIDPTTITPAPKLSVWQALEKRRGGGGGGRGGGSSGGSGGSSGGRSGSGGSGSRGGSSGRGGSNGGSSGGSSGGSTSSSSNRGGTSRGGSGRAPAYGGGSYYSGGSRTPYSAGSRSPGGLTPYLLPAAGLGLAGGALAYGAYAYPYRHDYNYTDSHSHKEESLPVVCVCEQYMECGCDDNNNSAFYESLFNGTEPKNGTNVRVVDVNGTQKIYVNGSLPNGTTVAENAAPATVQMAQTSGYLAMAAIALSAVYAL